MSTENVISIQISPEDKTAIENAIRTLEEELHPYVVALTPAQRRDLPKMKDKTLPFVEKVVEYTVTRPEFIPAFMNVPELVKDKEAFSILNTFLRLVTNIQIELDDTALLTGSEAYRQSLVYYNTVKQAAKMNVPGAKEVYDDLHKRFEHLSKEEPPATPPQS